jgi:hypothetical protein
MVAKSKSAKARKFKKGSLKGIGEICGSVHRNDRVKMDNTYFNMAE